MCLSVRGDMNMMRHIHSDKKVPGIFPGGKGGQCVRLTTLPHSRADCL